MGFFSSSSTKTKTNEGNTDVYGLHADSEDLPEATLVTEVPMGGAAAAVKPLPSAPPSSYQQPPPPPQSSMQQTTTTTTVASMQTIPSVFLTRFPTQMDHCPCCQAACRTRVVTFPNWVTWGLVVILLFLFWPLCWLPLFMTKTKQSDHYCTVCNMKVGTIGACTDCCVQSRW